MYTHRHTYIYIYITLDLEHLRAEKSLDALGARLRLARLPSERDFFIDNLLVRIHFIVVMIRWTGLAPRAPAAIASSSLLSLQVLEGP